MVTPTYRLVRTVLTRLMILRVYPVRSWGYSTFTYGPESSITGGENVTNDFRLVGHHELLDVLRGFPLVNEDHLLDTGAVHVEGALLQMREERAIDLIPHLIGSDLLGGVPVEQREVLVPEGTNTDTLDLNQVVLVVKFHMTIGVADNMVPLIKDWNLVVVRLLGVARLTH